jgi:hypothetical protein
MAPRKELPLRKAGKSGRQEESRRHPAQDATLPAFLIFLPSFRGIENRRFVSWLSADEETDA